MTYKMWLLYIIVHVQVHVEVHVDVVGCGLLMLRYALIC